MYNKLSIFVLTFLAAIALTIVPLPHWAVWLRPMWVPMLLITWVMLKPEWAHIGIAFVVGLFLDVLLGTIMGEHALALSFVCYFVARFHHNLKLFPISQQALVVFLLLFCYQFIGFWIQHFVSHAAGTWWYWLPILPSALLWPLLFWMMQSLTAERKF